jgi:hypothetical protein
MSTPSTIGGIIFILIQSLIIDGIVSPGYSTSTGYNGLFVTLHTDNTVYLVGTAVRISGNVYSIMAGSLYHSTVPVGIHIIPITNYTTSFGFLRTSAPPKSSHLPIAWTTAVSVDGSYNVHVRHSIK